MPCPYFPVGKSLSLRDVYWFAGKAFLGKCSATAVLSWNTVPGDYELTALDDHGRSASCKVKVR